MYRPISKVTVTPIHHDEYYVTVLCPFCGEEHKHVKEKSLPMGKPIGLRISLCRNVGVTENFNRGGYFICPIPKDCPTGRKKSLAQSRD